MSQQHLDLETWTLLFMGGGALELELELCAMASSLQLGADQGEREKNEQ